MCSLNVRYALAISVSARIVDLYYNQSVSRQSGGKWVAGKAYGSYEHQHIFLTNLKNAFYYFRFIRPERIEDEDWGSLRTL